MAATSVRERMDHLYNNPDMSDLTISATDQDWSWGNTSQEFIVSTRASNEDITITWAFSMIMNHRVDLRLKL